MFCILVLPLSSLKESSMLGKGGFYTIVLHYYIPRQPRQPQSMYKFASPQLLNCHRPPKVLLWKFPVP